MKTRDGFVTNSSSSSFIVAMRKDLTEAKIKEKVESVFLIDKKHPLYHLAKEMIKDVVYEILDCKERAITHYTELLEYYEVDTDEPDKFAENLISLFNKYGGLYIGSFDSIEQAMACDTDFEYEDDDIYFKNNGGH